MQSTIQSLQAVRVSKQYVFIPFHGPDVNPWHGGHPSRMPCVIAYGFDRRQSSHVFRVLQDVDEIVMLCVCLNKGDTGGLSG